MAGHDVKVEELSIEYPLVKDSLPGPLNLENKVAPNLQDAWHCYQRDREPGRPVTIQ